MIRTKLTKLLDIKLPLVSAPMSRHSGSTLAVAVTKAGGLGTFGALNQGGESWFRQEVASAKSSLGGRPFSVGFITHLMENFPVLFEIALEAKVPVIAFSFSDPTPYLDRVKSAGLLSMCQIQNFSQAKLAIDAGADILVVQGNEAGGHTGSAGLMELLSEVLNSFPNVSVLAAGGIGSGADLAKVINAGADGAWVGTRLLATHECVEVSEGFKEHLVRAEATDTSYTALFDKVNHAVFGGTAWPPGIAARLIRNQMLDTWGDRIPELLADESALANYLAEVKSQNPEYTPLYAGTSVSSVNAVQSAGDVVQEISRDAQAILG